MATLPTTRETAEHIYHRHDSFKQKVLNEGTKVQGRLAFCYLDAEGEATARVVDVQAYFQNSIGLYLVGHCHLRGELRAFESGVMWNVRDGLTGEFIGKLTDWLSMVQGTALTLPPLNADELAQFFVLPARHTVEEGNRMLADLATDLQSSPVSGKWVLRHEFDSLSFRRVMRHHIAQSDSASIYFFSRQISSTPDMPSGLESQVSVLEWDRPWRVWKRGQKSLRFTTFEDARSALVSWLGA